MATYEREMVKTLVSRLQEPPRHLIAIFGPRHTGKTTIIQQALSSPGRPSRHIDLERNEASDCVVGTSSSAEDLPRRPDMTWLVGVWNDARDKANSHPKGLILALDEIQTIPDWSRIVKGLWDDDRRANRSLYVIISGSVPMAVQSELSESLMGRFELVRVSHWSFNEMHRAFGMNLHEYLYFGGYPASTGFLSDAVRWRQLMRNNVIAPVIERDVLDMARVDKPAIFKQLFEIGGIRAPF